MLELLRYSLRPMSRGTLQSATEVIALPERARAARYDLMAAYCHAHDIPALVTALVEGGAIHPLPDRHSLG